jgi:hypothetical protein
MKPRRLAGTCLLLVTLTVSNVPACADESPATGTVLSATSSTTFNGYVDTAAVWRFQSQGQHGPSGWLRAFLRWLRFHAA